MKKLNKNNGITLISLVITIIIMLILVGVSINLAVNGGLFEYAGNAVGDTQNAIDVEKQLMNGKIKVGDKWYASINDYIKNNPIKTGIEITPTEVTLKKKETTDVEGEEVLSNEITASVYGMESEPEITWETASNAITLSTTKGKNVTVTAVGTTDATATITAKCTYEGEEYTETIKVTLEILRPIVTVEIGAFVEYDVEYTDVYIDKGYTSTNGWRLLHYDTDNDGRTIYNVELISTGVPAILNFYTGATAEWWITESDKIAEYKSVLEKYYGDGSEQYEFYNDTGKNVQAAAGMYYNLKDIPFYTKNKYLNLSSKNNVGYYSAIKVNETNETSEIYGSIFKTSNDYSVRMLTLPEINKDRGENITSTDKILTEPAVGLYVLQNLSSISEMANYSYSGSNEWYLASPAPNYDLYIKSVGSSGYVSSCDFKGDAFGIRPVIVLGANVAFTVSSDTQSDGLEYLKLTRIEN